MDPPSTRRSDAAFPPPAAAKSDAAGGAFARVLVGFGSVPGSFDALKLGARLAESSGAELILAAVLPGWPEAIAPGNYRGLALEEEKRVTREASALLGAREFEVEAIAGGTAAEGLRSIAGAEGADLIVIGSTHRGPVGRVLPGSVGERVLDGAPCAVAIAPRGLAERELELRRILVGCDGSRESLAAVRLAATLAEASAARLTLLGVVEMRFDLAGFPRPAAPAETARIERALQRARRSLSPTLSAAIGEVHGVAAEVIAAAAGEADLLVLGSRGQYGPLRRTFLGSVAAKLARTAPCATLITPA
jgi:nucleotide-binding universal stress UspA family protein